MFTNDPAGPTREQIRRSFVRALSHAINVGEAPRCPNHFDSYVVEALWAVSLVRCPNPWDSPRPVRPDLSVPLPVELVERAYKALEGQFDGTNRERARVEEAAMWERLAARRGWPNYTEIIPEHEISDD